MTAGTQRCEWRTLGLVLLGSGCAATASGIVYPVIVFNMEELQVPGGLIGLITSIWALPIILAGHLYPRVSQRFGTRASLTGGLVIAVMSLVVMPAVVNPYVWLGLQFLNGFTFGQFWVLSETWLNRNAPEGIRSRVTALYSLVPAVGATLGPAAATVTGFAGYWPFGIAALILTVGTVSITRAGELSPTSAELAPRSSYSVIWLAPPIFVVALVSGIFETVPWALLPLFGVRSGMSNESSTLMLTTFFSGQLVLSMLVGWLADRAGKHRALLIMCLLSIIGAGLLPVVVKTPLLGPTLFVWGACAHAFYSIGLAMLGSRFALGALTSANAIFVVLYSLGCFLGPPVVGFGMDRLGPLAFSFALAASAGVALLWIPLTREPVTGRVGA